MEELSKVIVRRTTKSKFKSNKPRNRSKKKSRLKKDKSKTRKLSSSRKKEAEKKQKPSQRKGNKKARKKTQTQVEREVPTPTPTSSESIPDNSKGNNTTPTIEPIPDAGTASQPSATIESAFPSTDGVANSQTGDIFLFLIPIIIVLILLLLFATCAQKRRNWIRQSRISSSKPLHVFSNLSQNGQFASSQQRGECNSDELSDVIQRYLPKAPNAPNAPLTLMGAANNSITAGFSELSDDEMEKDMPRNSVSMFLASSGLEYKDNGTSKEVPNIPVTEARQDPSINRSADLKPPTQPLPESAKEVTRDTMIDIFANLKPPIEPLPIFVPKVTKANNSYSLERLETGPAVTSPPVPSPSVANQWDSSDDELEQALLVPPYTTSYRQDVLSPIVEERTRQSLNAIDSLGNEFLKLINDIEGEEMNIFNGKKPNDYDGYDLEDEVPPAPTSHVVFTSYYPQSSDEIQLNEGDIMGIEREYPDGWARGQNISQGRKRCYFPLAIVTTIKSGPSQAVRRRDYTFRERVDLTAPSDILGSRPAGGFLIPERKESKSTKRRSHIQLFQDDERSDEE
jgi:hypothetical protein